MTPLQPNEFRAGVHVKKRGKRSKREKYKNRLCSKDLQQDLTKFFSFDKVLIALKSCKASAKKKDFLKNKSYFWGRKSAQIKKFIKMKSLGTPKLCWADWVKIEFWGQLIDQNCQKRGGNVKLSKKIDGFVKSTGHIVVVREESRHREKKGGSQVTARAWERERRRYSM